MKSEIETLPPGSRAGAIKDLTDDEITIPLAQKTPKLAEGALEKVLTLKERMEEAMNALDAACNRFRVDTLEWVKEGLPKILVEVRQIRAAFSVEFSQLVKQLEELRKFFIGPIYDEELKRLKDFVETCERLKVLKDSGFLDSVADTMLRLAR